MEVDFVKKYCSGFLGPKGLKVGCFLFKLFEKCTSRIFLIFCVDLQQHKVLYLTQMFWKKSCFEIFGPIGPQKYGFFFFFYSKLQWNKIAVKMQITKDVELRWFFVRNFVLKFFKFHSKSMHGTFLIFCMKL